MISLRPTRGPAAQRRPRAPQLLQEALCTAPATRKALCTAPATRSQPQPSGAHARRSSSRRLCVLRLPREMLRGSSQEALCTAPATRSQPRPSGAHARRSSSRRLCVLRRPCERQPGSSVYCACHTQASRGPAAPTRAAARPGGSVYCAGHGKGSQEALCTAPSSSRSLCVLRLPRERQPGSSVCCTSHTKPAAAQWRPRAPQLLQEALWTAPATLCTAPATRKPAAAQQRPRAPQLLQEALCTAPATRKAARKLCVLHLPHEASRGPAAPTRAAAPPGGSVLCACHAKGSQEAICTVSESVSE